MLALAALALTSLALTSSAAVRCAPPVMMGGLTGLPRIPQAALPLTKKWNPSGSYSERIATLWRDLETLYGMEDTAGLGGSRTYRDTNRYVDSGEKTNRFRGMTYSVDVREKMVLAACRKVPSLLNPDVSNRFVFATSKQILVQKLGSQQAAIDVMKADPSILQLGEKLGGMSASSIKGRGLSKQALSLLGPLVLVAAPALYLVNEQM